MKPRLSNDVIAMRIAAELKEGEVVNVGFGLVSGVSSFAVEKHPVFHSENGVAGYGSVLTEEEIEKMDYNLVNAGGQFLAPEPGMVFMDVSETLACVWTGKVDTTVLGAFQVSEKGDLASWSTAAEGDLGSIGGAMDMASGAKRIIVGMEHTDKRDRPKILKECSLPLTAPRCVNLIVTDLAVIEVTRQGLVLKEIAPGWTVEEVQALTEPRLIVGEVKEMQF